MYAPLPPTSTPDCTVEEAAPRSGSPREYPLARRPAARRRAKPGTVSVVIPTYNGSEFIAAALESVLRQTRKPDQVIVADDGSRDHTVEIVDRFRRRHCDRISLCIHPAGVNRGIAATYQLATAHTGGDYLAFLEQDDRWPADHLERRLQVLDDKPEVGAVFCPYRVVAAAMAGWEMRLRQRILARRLPKDEAFDNFGNLIGFNNVATLSCLVARRALVTNTPPPPPDIPMYFFDWWTLCHLSARAPFYYDPQSKVAWRVSPASALGSVAFDDLRTMVAVFLRALYSSLLHDRALSPQHRRLVRRHAASLPHLVALYHDPGVGTAARFLAVDPRWAIRCFASLLVNSVKHG